MNVKEWNKKYVESIHFIEKRIPQIKGVIAAYNSNIDAIVHVRSNDFEKILNKEPKLIEKLLVNLEKTPSEIYDKEDFFAGLLKCLRNGTGEELIIKNKNVFDWMESTFKYDHLRIGGQAGIIANTLARLAVPNVIVHAPALPEAQASLFFENVKIPAKKGNQVFLESPMNAVRRGDEKMVHYVFEFNEGTRIKVNDICFESPRANRFVATWDPKNTELEIDPAFLDLKINGKADRAIIAGYHLLKPNYPDGSTHIDKIRYTASQVKRWKKENPNLFIHLELGDSKHKEIYASTLSFLSPFIDGLGLNENELLKASSSLNLINSAEPFNAVMIFETAKRILEYLNISLILIHTLDFSLCIINSKKYSYPTEHIQNAIIFGALLAAIRALTSEYNDIDRLKKEMNTPLLSLSSIGMTEHSRLAEYLEKSYGTSRDIFLNTGIAKLENYHIIFVVSKLTEKPATTAGLGDSLIAGYILGVKFSNFLSRIEKKNNRVLDYINKNNY